MTLPSGRYEWRGYVARLDHDGLAEFVASLGAGGGDLVHDEYGVTPLIAASALARLYLCELLLQAGADPGARDQFGRNAPAAFGSDCRAESEPAPGDWKRRKARHLFAAWAASSAAGLPAEYCLAFRGGTPADAAGRAQVYDLFGRVRELLRAERLPVPLHGSDFDSVRLWLLTGEVARARAAVTRAAAQTGFEGGLDFEAA